MAFRMPSQHEKAAFVQDRFGRIARRYDLFNDLITQTQHRRWKRSLINLIQLRPSMRVLDICCGTGDIALRACQKLRGQGIVVAADFSPPMLAIAKHRLQAYPFAQTIIADALQLPFANQAFDVITVGYGLRNVANLEICLKELLRVLKPGGRLACLDIGKSRLYWLKPFTNAYMFHIVPLIGTWLMPGEDMFEYLPYSTQHYPSQDKLTKLFQQTGFSSVYLKEYLFGISALHIAHKPE